MGIFSFGQAGRISGAKTRILPHNLSNKTPKHPFFLLEFLVFLYGKFRFGSIIWQIKNYNF